MPWVKLDDQFPGHPKLASISPAWRPLAVFLHINGLCWCNQYLTDGVIPKSLVSRLAPEVELLEMQTQGPLTAHKVAEELAAAGLWEDRGDTYVIHDFHDFQPSRREVESRRRHISATRKQAGSKGGSKRVANRQTNAQQTGKQDAKQTCSPVPVPVPEKEREKTLSRPGTLEARAGAWLERFPGRYFEARQVPYVGNVRRDFEEACRIAEAVPDDAVLELVTDVYLRSENRDLGTATRTPGRMRAQLSALLEHVHAHARRTA